MQHITFILSDSHSGFYFPPGRLRWQSADDPMVQTVSPETCGLPFRLKELRTFACFPVSQHSGFYFPPSANKDRAVNIIEIKDFIILWTYSQWWQDLVIIPPFSPERETCCILPLIVFRMLILCKKRTFHFIPAICKYCTVSSRRVAVFNVTWPI